MGDAPRLIWDTAGRPSPVESAAKLLTDTPAACAICGVHTERSASFDRALGASFTDRSLIVAATSRVCPACLWACSGKPPATLRMWTVVCTPGRDLPPSQPKAWVRDTPGLCLTSRADTTPVTAALTNPPDGPWVVTVAASGQKHVVPYGRVQHGDGQWTVRVETTDVTATPALWRHVRSTALALRRLGVPADAIENGEPRFLRTRDQLAAWRDLDAALTGHHRTPLLSLALWTITKKEITTDDQP